jgi:hypothetical protein
MVTVPIILRSILIMQMNCDENGALDFGGMTCDFSQAEQNA